MNDFVLECVGQYSRIRIYMCRIKIVAIVDRKKKIPSEMKFLMLEPTKRKKKNISGRDESSRRFTFYAVSKPARLVANKKFIAFYFCDTLKGKNDDDSCEDTLCGSVAR